MRFLRSIAAASALVALALSAPVAAQPAAPPQADGSSASLRVFVRGAFAGTIQSDVVRTASGVTFVSSGGLGRPLNIAIKRVEVRYDAEWRPQELTVNATIGQSLMVMHTTFAGGSAVTSLTQGGQSTQKTDAVAADTLVLPNTFFGTYEALAARLSTLAKGATLRIYVAPQAEIGATVDEVSTERIQTPGRTVVVRRYQMTFANPGAPLSADVWIDEDARLVRLRIPAAAIEVAREDVASVGARQLSMTRETDEDVRVPAIGFSLAGTLSKPAAAAAPANAAAGGAGRKQPATRWPAVILIAGSGPQDRDETVAGVPIFGQLAGAIADAGFFVLRYDKRGVGQSGGRPETASLVDYAEDAWAVVRFLRDRKDIDPKRVALIGHSEGAWVGLIAASKHDQIAALAMLAGPGTTGAELVLEQQRRLLDKSGADEAEKQSKIELQKKIQAAAATGAGWEGIPPELRRQADTPWFQSFLTFDPARSMKDARQPILILQGELDTQVTPRHADALATLARARKKGGAVDLQKLAGVNHLLVPAKTGEVDEYAALPDKQIDASVSKTVTEWLARSLPAPAK